MVDEILHILCLEDTPEDAELVQLHLLREGYQFEFIQTNNEKEFLEILTNRKLDLILSDYNLPGFTGISALKLARKYCPHVPFVCVSGTIGEELAVELLKLGASDYVLKDRLDKLPLAINRALAEVRERESRLSAERNNKILSMAIEQSPVSVCITDLMGCIEYSNPKYSEMSGYRSDELLGKNPRILKSGKMEDEIYAELWATILSGNSWRGELINKGKDGNFYWVNESVFPIISEKGEITHFVSIAEDITQKKETEQELIVAKERAEESDRLKTAFLQNMSHEIRTPMNGILGFSGLLQNPNLPESKQHQYIKLINESGNRLLNIINDIIDISKIESGQTNLTYQEVDLVNVFNYLQDFFKPEADKKEIRLIVDAELGALTNSFTTDSIKLTQVLINLIKNALKFTVSGSIRFGCSATEKTVLFFVQDSGIGISPELRDVIFDRFRQGTTSLNRNYEGAGLGLAISKAFVELLGGKIWFESEENRGSTFFFTITSKSN